MLCGTWSNSVIHTSRVHKVGRASEHLLHGMQHHTIICSGNIYMCFADARGWFFTPPPRGRNSSNLELSDFEGQEGGGESNIRNQEGDDDSWLGMDQAAEQSRVKRRKLSAEAIHDNQLWSAALSPRSMSFSYHTSLKMPWVCMMISCSVKWHSAPLSLNTSEYVTTLNLCVTSILKALIDNVVFGFDWQCSVWLCCIVWEHWHKVWCMQT